MGVSNDFNFREATPEQSVSVKTESEADACRLAIEEIAFDENDKRSLRAKIQESLGVWANMFLTMCRCRPVGASDKPSYSSWLGHSGVCRVLDE